MISYLLVITLVVGDSVGLQVRTWYPSKSACLDASAKVEVRLSQGVPDSLVKATKECVQLVEA